MRYLRQNTAINILVGPFVSDSDGSTLDNGVDVTTISCDLFKGIVKSDLSLTAPGGDNDCVFVSMGNYNLELTASNINTLGHLRVSFDVAGMIPFYEDFTVLDAVTYDQMYGSEGLPEGVAGSSAISTPAQSFVLATGNVVSGDYTLTKELDNIYHQIEDTGGVLDCYYEFNVGGNGIPSQVIVNGRLNSANDTVNVFAWNWGESTWEQIGEYVGQGSAIDIERIYNLFTDQVGTGVNIGKVRIRFQGTGLTSADLYLDQIFVSYSVVFQSVGYADGAIWLDTLNGIAGTTSFVNGVADNPVDTLADALTIAAAIGLKRIRITGFADITFDQNMDNFFIKGDAHWDLNLGGQSCDNITIVGANISGVSTGALHIIKGHLLVVSFEPSEFHETSIDGDITLLSSGDYFFDTCRSGVAGLETPSIDLGVSVGNVNINFRRYSGGIEVKNMGQNGTDKMSLEGDGLYILNANCVGGELHVRGSFQKIDNTAGVVNITEVANIKTDTIHDGYARASTTNTIQLAVTASSVSDAYDPAIIFIVAGEGVGQSRLILEYTGAMRMAVVDRNWKTLPNTTSEYRIVANPGREHVNEGLARAGTINTITLNSLGSPINGVYVGQTVFLRSGQGEDQTRIVAEYVGSTKVATLDRNWDIIPNTTSGYVVLPSQLANCQEILSRIGTPANIDGGGANISDNIKKMVDDNGGANFDATTDSLKKGFAEVNVKIGTPIALAGGTVTLAGMINQLADNENGDYGNGESLHDIAGVGGAGITQQQVRDAFKLAPSSGDPAEGSIDAMMSRLLGLNYENTNHNSFVYTDKIDADGTTRQVLLSQVVDVYDTPEHATDPDEEKTGLVVSYNLTFESDIFGNLEGMIVVRDV